jgi:diguanylate cyclase (GGDEF)-like protein
VSTLIPFPGDRARRPSDAAAAARELPAAADASSDDAAGLRIRRLAGLAVGAVGLAVLAGAWALGSGQATHRADLEHLRGVDRLIAAVAAGDAQRVVAELDTLPPPPADRPVPDAASAGLSPVMASLRDPQLGAEQRGHALERLYAARAALEARVLATPPPGWTASLLLLAALCATAGLALAAVARLMVERRRRAEAERVLTQALDDAQSMAEGLRRLGEFGGMLQSCRGIGEAMMLLRAAAPGVLGAANGAVYLLRGDGETLERTGGFGADRAAGAAEFARDDCWALRRNQAHPAPEDSAAPCCAHHAASTARAVLCIPLAAQAGSIGVLALESARPLAPEQRRLGLALGERLSLALSNIALQESLRLQSLRDPLTGVYNRRYLEDSLPRELSRAGRRGRPLCLLAVDIDHFKRINDTYGHDAGDAVLARIATLMATRSREEDIVCRVGGEEFLLIMPEADLAAATRRADQLREAVRSIHFESDGRVLPPVTVSIGVAQWCGAGRDGGALKAAADRALYAAKRGGRDRVVAASE